ncbi:hypothetical protein F3Y22_tig00007179pilonHSYRG00049 [Hibiscus syriacus]|uniref:Uncharacterized protein n=1 Tax=Hibiscus syriacus TaxID=106335 RepID=A0A6A3CGK3_HIBSY|nr:hypothetical protein F3Y22_tig00007179pilonHSYRG00049 [Hibiscus syriacus]
MGSKKKVKDDERMERTIRALLKLPENKGCINCNILRARQIYFKAWDPLVHSFPDGSNIHKLRDFIRQVYVERRYASENEKGDSLPYTGRILLKAGRTVYLVVDPEVHCMKIEENGVQMKDLVLLEEIVDNRLRPEGSRSARQQDNPEFPHREPVRRSRSFSLELGRSGSPVEQPVRDSLGETAPAIQVGEHSNENAARDPDGSAENQKNASPGVLESLIDFSMDSEPSNEVAAPNVQQVPPSNDDSQSSDDFSSKGKAPPVSNPNYLEALLFDLSDLSVVPVDNVSAAPGTTSAPSIASGQNISLDGFSTASAPQFLALTSTDVSSTVPQVVNIQQYPFNPGFQATTDVNGDYKVKASEGHSFPGMQQHQLSLFSASDNNFSAHPYTRAHRTSFLMHISQQLTNVSTAQSYQATSTSAIETTYGVGVQPPAETKSNKRKELPQDLFAAGYGSAPGAFPSWQNALPYGMGFGLQYYPNAMNVAAFPSTAKTNPFDSDATPGQVPAFPSMASYLGALPSVQDPTALSHASGLDSSSVMAYHSSYTASSPMTLGSPFISAIPSAYMGDQSHILLQHSRLQGNSGFDGSNYISSSSRIDQRPMSVLSASNPPNSDRGIIS